MNEEPDTSNDSIRVQSAGSPDIEPLEEEYNNALAHMEHQQEILKEFSREGMKMFRVLILFIAVPATILGAFSIDTLLNFSGLLVNSETAVSFPSNVDFTHEQMFVSTGVAAILAIAFHIPATGQEYKGIRNPTNPNDMGLLINHDITEESYLRMKLELLCSRIEENREVLKVMENLLAAGKIFTQLTVFGVGVIFYNIVTGAPVSGFVLVGVGLLIMGIEYKLPRNYVRADNPFLDADPYDEDPDIVIMKNE